jgi:hypothetical protein
MTSRSFRTYVNSIFLIPASLFLLYGQPRISPNIEIDFVGQFCTAQLMAPVPRPFALQMVRLTRGTTFEEMSCMIYTAPPIVNFRAIGSVVSQGNRMRICTKQCRLSCGYRRYESLWDLSLSCVRLNNAPHLKVQVLDARIAANFDSVVGVSERTITPTPPNSDYGGSPHVKVGGGSSFDPTDNMSP